MKNIDNPYAHESCELPPDHPGIHDEKYVARRNDFYRLGKYYRLHHQAPPLVTYEDEEHLIWQKIFRELEEIHQEKACQIYLQGKSALNLEAHQLPQLKTLGERLTRSHGVGIVPVEGLLDSREFLAYLSRRIMPSTQFLRHGANVAYTPEPDIVHDVIGHIPPLMNEEYTQLMELIGHCAIRADDSLMSAIQHLYWYAIEFGLIIENDELKVFGAGLLSSFGEMEYCFSDKVTRKPFVMEEVISRPYDTMHMQDTVFYIPSFKFLIEEIKKFFGKYGKV